MYSIILIGVRKSFSPSQTIGFLFTLVAFLIVITGNAFSWGIPSSMQMMRGPVTALAFIYLILQLAFGGIWVQLNPEFSVGLTGCICIILLVVFLLVFMVYRSRISGALSQEKETGRMVSEFRTMTATADSVAGMVQEPEAKKFAREIADLLRYSDPVSSPGLSEVEERIQDNLKLWKQAAEDKDDRQFQRRGQKLKELITERNSLCLALKRS